jgi:hypothetical protein
MLACLALAPWNSRAGMPLPAERTTHIAAQASAAGYPVDLGAAIETAEDPDILFVPSSDGDPGVMLLYDTQTRRAVLVQDQSDDGYHLSVVQPDGPPVVELDLGADGYFGPPDRLESLGLTDSAIATTQAVACRQACFDQANHLGCAACTGVSVLVAMRTPQVPPEPSPTDSEPTEVATPEPSGEGSPTPSADALTPSVPTSSESPPPPTADVPLAETPVADDAPSDVVSTPAPAAADPLGSSASEASTPIPPGPSRVSGEASGSGEEPPTAPDARDARVEPSPLPSPGP